MTELTDEQKQILQEAITDFNDTLTTQSINLSGQAFNNAFRLGCLALLLPLIIVLVAVNYVRGELDFSGVFVFSCAGAAASIVFASIVANRAKFLAVQDKYQQDVNPEIVRFLAEHQFTRAQFDVAADDILAENAPLRDYLIKSSDGQG